ncbi:unnamed protein product, partial [Haemonchus placei]|uniref:Aa_trans domain-containing protein n=1 Tax=Haemonchus placei TaxID=6290 RepID=A0A0N4XBA3_HAEPC
GTITNGVAVVVVGGGGVVVISIKFAFADVDVPAGTHVNVPFMKSLLTLSLRLTYIFTLVQLAFRSVQVSAKWPFTSVHF